MKTIDLVTRDQAVETIFDLAENEDVLIRLPNGRVFLLTSVAGLQEGDDNFAEEVAQTRRSVAVMALLDERSADTSRISAQDARKRLGLE